MAKQLTSAQIRQMFLDYFKQNGHMVEPGASLIPHNDPTLLWINAGVAALKKYFDGSEKPANRRICNAQKSIRTNDIENVGRTARHHTFFEMLGNFSIGDYFKKEAIPFAWHFLTDPEWMGFDKDRWYITVYPQDQEAYDIWTKQLGVSPSHILKSEDNFWQIGEGPCGPDTEMYYDRGPAFDPQGLGEKLFFDEMENDRYVEIWNVVFSQFNAVADTPREQFIELPQKNIDTGMGLERLVCISQGGETNFDTDLFLPIIAATEKLTAKKYSDPANKMAFRVIADHIRTVTFALADGATFSNEGRGYILRRVLRRAARFGRSLGISGSFMYKLVKVVADNMIDYYPYLQEKVSYIEKLVKAEEERFASTLNDGEKLLTSVLDKSDSKILAGETVFKLYDTFGFPPELTKEIASDKGFTIDQAGFDECMQQQKERARAARSAAESMSAQSADLMSFTQPSVFVGYDNDQTDGKVIGLFKDGVKIDEISDEGDIIMSQTCFYAESGGQLYDQGTMSNPDTELQVVKVEKAPNKQALHHVTVLAGKIRLNDTFHLEIDASARRAIRANHSSLHLLQAALRQVIGSHVHQAGSYVCADYARFDFTHYEKISAENLAHIEDIVNKQIAAGYPVVTDLMDLAKAKETGAMALFDEKYEEVVRVVSMGDVSKELCGGTHVSNTSQIGVFKIVSEESIGSGIRRITVKTSYGAYRQFIQEESLLDSIAGSVKMNSYEGLTDKVKQLAADNAALSRQIGQLNDQLQANQADAIVASAVSHDGLNIVIKKIDGDTGAIKPLTEKLAGKMGDNGVVMLYGSTDSKVMFFAAAGKAAIAKGIKASDLVKQAAAICGGNGGGRPDMASAGGKDVAKADQAAAAVRQALGL